MQVKRMFSKGNHLYKYHTVHSIFQKTQMLTYFFIIFCGSSRGAAGAGGPLPARLNIHLLNRCRPSHLSTCAASRCSAGGRPAETPSPLPTHSPMKSHKRRRLLRENVPPSHAETSLPAGTSRLLRPPSLPRTELPARAWRPHSPTRRSASRSASGGSWEWRMLQS